MIVLQIFTGTFMQSKKSTKQLTMLIKRSNHPTNIMAVQLQLVCLAEKILTAENMISKERPPNILPSNAMTVALLRIAELFIRMLMHNRCTRIPFWSVILHAYVKQMAFYEVYLKVKCFKYYVHCLSIVKIAELFFKNKIETKSSSIFFVNHKWEINVSIFFKFILSISNCHYSDFLIFSVVL